MIKIVTIVGARPQIIKAAALSRTIRNKFSSQIKEIIVHTGQHYDANMSQVFFDELQIPSPHVNLNIGSASHGKQTGMMIEGIEKILIDEKPDFIVLYGDTNSTLAGAVAASKLFIPIIHIEAGLRSFNKKMPEEINRVLCDHASTLLFVPTHAGINNLRKEGINIDNNPPYTNDNPAVFHCGDIMFDNLLYYSDIADKNTDIIEQLGLLNKDFILTTIHRDNNTDIPERMNAIFSAINRVSLAHHIDIVLPLHPRTEKLMEKNLQSIVYEQIKSNSLIHLIPSVSYLEMMALEKNCRLVLTDSGGVQKEAYFFKKPLVVARAETEWVEIIENGAGVIADADENLIFDSVHAFLSSNDLSFPTVFGDGHAAEFICKTITKYY